MRVAGDTIKLPLAAVLKYLHKAGRETAEIFRMVIFEIFPLGFKYMVK